MLSGSSDSTSPRLGRSTVFAFRMILALVWLYDGLFSKILFPADSLLLGYGEVAAGMDWPAVRLLAVLGVMEVVLAVFVALGSFHQWVAFAQVVMTGLLLWVESSDFFAFTDRFFRFLPLLTCVLFVWIYGPGPLSARRPVRRKHAWTRG